MWNKTWLEEGNEASSWDTGHSRQWERSILNGHTWSICQTSNKRFRTSSEITPWIDKGYYQTTQNGRNDYETHEWEEYQLQNFIAKGKKSLYGVNTRRFENMGSPTSRGVLHLVIGSTKLVIFFSCRFFWDSSSSEELSVVLLNDLFLRCSLLNGWAMSLMYVLL